MILKSCFSIKSLESYLIKKKKSTNLTNASRIKLSMGLPQEGPSSIDTQSLDNSSSNIGWSDFEYYSIAWWKVLDFPCVNLSSSSSSFLPSPAAPQHKCMLDEWIISFCRSKEGAIPLNYLSSDVYLASSFYPF